MEQFSFDVVGEPEPGPDNIPESVVQDIWDRMAFDQRNLTTTRGESVSILDAGTLNTNQGPDFLSAVVRIDSVVWRGSVEIHRRSTEWVYHGHHRDVIYNNVVLHVTLVADRMTGSLSREDGSVIPEIVLLPRLTNSLRFSSWQHAISTGRDFPCQEHFGSVPALIVDSFLEDLASSRLDVKVRRLATRYVDMPDINQILYEEVFRSLGYMPNAESMVLLARRITLGHLNGVQSLFDAQALLLGTAGLVPRTHELIRADRSAADFAVRILERYETMERPASVRQMPSSIWRWSRMRPSNFPPVRIAQAAALFCRRGKLSVEPVLILASVIDSNDPWTLLRTLFSDPGDAHWALHTSLTRARKRTRETRIGKDRIVTIAVNAVLPVLMLHAELIDDIGLAVAVRESLGSIPATADSVTRQYSRRRSPVKSAAQSQGLHELYRTWCSAYRCRQCPIGCYLNSQGVSIIESRTESPLCE